MALIRVNKSTAPAVPPVPVNTYVENSNGWSTQKTYTDGTAFSGTAPYAYEAIIGVQGKSSLVCDKQLHLIGYKNGVVGTAQANTSFSLDYDFVVVSREDSGTVTVSITVS